MAIYRSNLIAPDLAPHFKLKVPANQMMGHDAPSDPDFLPECGFLTHDEAAILHNVAVAWPKRWVDIGARLGWTAAHIAAAGALVMPVDPELRIAAFSERFEQNLMHCWDGVSEVSASTSEDHFSAPSDSPRSVCDAAMIDGCHDSPEPTLDAMRAIKAGASVLVWHDFQGKPVRDAVYEVLKLRAGCQECYGTGRTSPFSSARECSQESGLHWKARVYWTPNMMAVAWRDGCGFVPPDHVRDPAIDWTGMERIVAEDFDVSRCA